MRDSDGRELRVPAGRERTLLVLLLLHRGEVVSTDRIADALWGERPPGTAAKALQGYVSHLRRLLGDEGPRLLRTQAPGYVLERKGLDVDADRFEALAAQGRRALADGHPAAAAETLEAALGLWRGPALAEVAFEDFAREEIQRLEELRLAATEDRGDALLALGGHRELVAELDALVAANPLRERLRGQAMLARYRCGRQADALALYDDGRRLLDQELGLAPGPDLQRLQRAILEQDPALDAPPPSSRAPAPAPQAARQSRPRRRGLAAGALAAAALVAAALAVVLTRDDAPAAVRIATPSVVAVDPATNRVVASIAVGSKPASLAADGDTIWVGDARDGTVTQVNVRTRRVVKTVGIGAPAIDLAVGSGSVWAATGGFGTIVEVDGEVGAVRQRIELASTDGIAVPQATSVSAGDGRVWVGTYDGLARIDPRSGRVAERVDLGKRAALQSAAANGAVWATTISRLAKRVEASSARVTAEFHAGEFALALAVGDSAVWLGAGDDGTLWKLDPVTGTTILTTRAGTGASGVALGAGAVWVTSWQSKTLVRVDPATGEVVASIPTVGAPEDVAFGGGLVWVAVQKPEVDPFTEPSARR